MMEDFDPDLLALDKELEEIPREKEVGAGHDDLDDNKKDEPLEGREDEGQEDPGEGKLEEPKAVDSPAERKNLRDEASSLQHLLTHLPKNPYCMSCHTPK